MVLLSFLTAAVLGFQGPDPACYTTANAASLAKRASPLDSVAFSVAGVRVKVCYGRPSSRGRTMLGGHNVPWGQLWRTGANEPTMIHTTGPVRIAGIPLDQGTYSLYTIPGERSWVIILNRSTDQWGDEASYSNVVMRQEVGRGEVRAWKAAEHVEQFTIRPEGKGGAVALLLEWEHTRLVLPVEVSGAP